jgi:hypothetical protein
MVNEGIGTRARDRLSPGIRPPDEIRRMTVLAKNLEDLSVPLHPVESTTPDDEPIPGLGAKRRHLRLV